MAARDSQLVNKLINIGKGGARNGKTIMFSRNKQMTHFMESFNLGHTLLNNYVLNNYKRTFIFIFLISIVSAQDSDLKKIFDPSQHRDVQPNWPVIINNVLPRESAIDSILTADTIHWLRKDSASRFWHPSLW